MKIGILGAGGIAVTMANTLNGMKQNGEDVELYAVAARDAERAASFAKEHGFTKSFGSYEEMLSDAALELIYIATPHSHHYEHVKLCLEHGKHVLCEKAFTANAKQAEEILAMAEQKKLLLTEAIWTRYMPSRKMLDDVVASGVIGKITSLSANLGYVIHTVPRIMQPELAGGALLDLTVYPINAALMIFGDDIQKIDAMCVKTETGVDGQDTVVFTYGDGKMATMYTTIFAQSDRRVMINGDAGYIQVENVNNYEAIKVYDLDRELIEEYSVPKQITGYEYEVRAAMKAIREGRIECPEMPHSETIKVMKIMDEIRAIYGIEYPFEK
ncbi:MAG TPA: Gfo/Idh/MocA family oxidoreductase [Lachnospiraceae bacterium]|nr:Gfo/Idh/MocA family oxidoreductase [Lachnospiraceae bacterium]